MGKNSVAKYSRPIEFEETLIKWPNLKISLTQFGWPWMKETAMLMLKHQIMFASANPRFEQIRMSDAFSKLNLRESTKKLIMGENAKEFLGLRK